MNKHRTEHNDPIRNLEEGQDHRQDPDSFTGFHPSLEGRPNRYGYFLLFIAVLIILIMFVEPTDLALGGWYARIVQTAAVALLLVLGVKLIKTSGSRRSHKRKN